MKSSLSFLSCVVVLGLSACDSKPGAADSDSKPSGAAAAPSGAEDNGSESSQDAMATKSGERDGESKPGMKTTASGLKYEVLKSGDGKVNPKETDMVMVHYHGTLLDGTVFDSSVDRDKPASFPLNRVIPGWTEGVQLMRQGDKFKFEIPSDLAYGPAGRPPVIPPNSTLVFEVELLEIK